MRERARARVSPPRSSASGNAIFYILIAVALIAALSYAVARGGRSGEGVLTQDRTRLLAVGILDYADTVRKAVMQLRLRGVSLADLSFAHPDLAAAYGVYDSAPGNEIFNPQGGGVIYQAPDPDARTAAADYIFSAGAEVKDIGTTCADDACAELVMAVPGLREEVCLAINLILDVDNPGGAPPEDSDPGLAVLYAGTATYAQTIGDEPDSANVSGRNAFCLKSGIDGDYLFIQVLEARRGFWGYSLLSFLVIPAAR